MTESMSPNRLGELANACVHCGFCLPSCPTYQLWGEEMDSPRGRIALMKLGLEGEPIGDRTAEHFDRCLGCMACVTACPSGVKYDVLITAQRSELEQTRPRTRSQRLLRGLIFGLFPYPRRLRALRLPLWLARLTRIDRLAGSAPVRRIAPGLSTMASIAPAPGPRTRLPDRIPASGDRRAVVGMLLGCVQREFFPQVNTATARVLAAEGCDVVVPPGQGCCGALSGHAGRRDEAIRFAKRTIETFENAGVDAIVVNSAGCGSAMKEYAELLANEPQWSVRARLLADRTRDFAEFLAELGPRAVRHPVPAVVAYHDACHLAHAQRVRDQPRALLSGIPELEIRAIPDGDTCCGSAGVYNLVQPGPARELGDRKADNVATTEADLLVSGNPGCAMQIRSALRRRGRDLPVAHLAELLYASIDPGRAGRFPASHRW